MQGKWRKVTEGKPRVHVEDGLEGAQEAVDGLLELHRNVGTGGRLKFIVVRRGMGSPVLAGYRMESGGAVLAVNVCPSLIPCVIRNRNGTERNPVTLWSVGEAVAFAAGHEYGHFLCREAGVELRGEDEEGYCDSVGARVLAAYQGV